MLKCLSLIAVSSKPQTTRESPQEQRRENLRVIQQLDGVLVEELEISGQSREIISFEEACNEIAAYARLREIFKRNETEAEKYADLLVFRDLGRLARENALAAQITAYCWRAGIALYPIKSPPATLDAVEQAKSLGQNLTNALEGVVFKNQMNEMRDRRAFGMLGRTKRGEFSGNIPLPWQRSANGEITVDEAARHTLRLALLEMYLRRGLSTREAAREMAALGYRAPGGGPWTKSTYFALFDRLKRYAGFAEFNKRSKTGGVYAIHPGAFPAILTPEEYAALVAERARRGVTRTNSQHPHLFSGCVICEHCLEQTAGRVRMAAMGGGRWRFFYRCNVCAGSFISDRKLLDALTRWANHLRARRDAIETMAGNMDEIDNTKAALERAEMEKAAYERQRMRLVDAYFTDGASLTQEEYRWKMNDLAAQIAGVQTRLDTLREQADRQEDVVGRRHRIEDIILNIDDALDEELHDILSINAWIRSRFIFTVRGKDVVSVLLD